MFIGIVQVFFGMVLLATGVFSNSEEDDNFVAIRTCIATSKNQTLCDEFVACGVYLPKRVWDCNVYPLSLKFDYEINNHFTVFKDVNCNRNIKIPFEAITQTI
ncbi:hypothetical protein NPIL_502271 [Nephila pilipes]|uniref:Uncharacterized protein n=1 Tax=Nephila pilipes TaxID=299642 RepID=A0A8X6MMQ4_NEPPI|nr:hypothetical protein NPIL_502271 [Nephila pilipes]